MGGRASEDIFKTTENSSVSHSLHHSHALSLTFLIACDLFFSKKKKLKLNKNAFKNSRDLMVHLQDLL